MNKEPCYKKGGSCYLFRSFPRWISKLGNPYNTILQQLSKVFHNISYKEQGTSKIEKQKQKQKNSYTIHLYILELHME